MIIVVAAVVRIVWVVAQARNPVGGDPLAYMYHGQQIADGQGYRSMTAALLQRVAPAHSGHLPPTAFYPVGYPATLGALFAVVLHLPFSVSLPKTVGFFQAVLGVASVALLAEIGRRLFSARVGLIAAAVLALWPNLVFYTAEAHVETEFIFLLLAAVLVAVSWPWGAKRPTRARLVALGVLVGAAALVRPQALIVIPLLVACLLLARVPWRRALRVGGWSLAVAAVVVAPWLVRNKIVMHATVFSTGMGDAMCLSRHPGATGHFEIASRWCLSGYENLPLDQREVKRNARNTRNAFTWVAHHPLTEARMWGVRGYYGYRDDHETLEVIPLDRTNPLHGSSAVTALERVADGYYYVFGVLAVLSLPLFVGRGRERRLLVLLVGISNALVPFLLFGDPRYKVPVLPFFALGAAAAIDAVIRRRGRDASPRTTTTSPPAAEPVRAARAPLA